MATSNSYVVRFKSQNGSVLYSALDSRDSLIKSENPTTFKKFFSHSDATNLVKALRAKGLEEGLEIRVKTLAQSIRDYGYSLVQKSKEATLTDNGTMEKVLKRYEVKKVEETKKEESTKEVEE